MSLNFLAIFTLGGVFGYGHVVNRACVRRHNDAARDIFTGLGDFTQMGGDLFHRGEPDVSCINLLFEKARYHIPPGQSSSGKGMHNCHPQPAIFPDRVEFLNVGFEPYGWGHDIAHVSQVFGLHELRPVIQPPMRRQFHQLPLGVSSI